FSSIAGWFITGIDANVILWNSTHDLIMNNTFSTLATSLFIYNNNATNSNNVIFGNYFMENTSNMGNVSYNYIGIQVWSANNLLYNNYFMVETPVINGNYNWYWGGYALNINKWNITKEPLNYTMEFNGYILTGNVLHKGYQGGNFWWNFNGQIPFNENGMINSGGDYLPLYFTMNKVTLIEQGLAYGINWERILYNDTYELLEFNYNNLMGQIYYLLNGTYSFSFWAQYYNAIPSYLNLYINSNETFIITFKKLYNVTFTESGLPAGTEWSVTLNGVTETANTSVIAFTEPNGTYEYTIGTVTGYTASPSSGTITVNGTNVTEAITFQKLYNVTFIESGLPVNTSWTVNLNGEVLSSNTSSITFQKVNGTYNFNINTITYGSNIYIPNPAFGSLTINGNDLIKVVTFKPEISMEYSFANLTPILNREMNNLTQLNIPLASHGNYVLFSGYNNIYTESFLVLYNKSSNTYKTVQTLENENINDILWVGNGFLIDYTNNTGHEFFELFTINAMEQISLPSNFANTYLEPIVYYNNTVYMIYNDILFAFNNANYSMYNKYNLNLPLKTRIFSGVVGDSYIFLYGQILGTNTSQAFYGIFNITTGKFLRLSPVSPLENNSHIYTVILSSIYLNNNFYFSGFTGYFNPSPYLFQTRLGLLYVYNPYSNTTTNISKYINTTGQLDYIFNISNNLGIINWIGTFNSTTSYQYNEFLVYNITNNNVLNYTSILGYNFEVYSGTVSNNYAYFIGQNITNNEVEFLIMNETTLSTVQKYFTSFLGSYYSGYWTANSISGGNGFMTLGGNGLVFYKNGLFYAPNQMLPGFLLDAAWNGNYFLVVGNTYWYSTVHGYQANNGPIMGIYYPENNTLISLDNIIPGSLSVNATFDQVIWNGSSFLILGEQSQNASLWDWNTILYSYSPGSGLLKNITNLLPPDFLKAHMTGMLNTPYGTFILLYSFEYGIRFGELTGTSFTDLSNLIPNYFIFNNWWQYGTAMAYGNGLIFVAGNNYNGSIFAITYNPLTKQIYNYGGLFNSFSGNVNNVAYEDGLFYIYGISGNIDVLLALNPVSGQVYNLTGYLPAGFAMNKVINTIGINTIAAENNTIYLTGGSWSNIYYGLLNITPKYLVIFNESGLPPGVAWYVNITGEISSGPLTGNSYYIYLPNGNYSYIIATVNKSYAPTQSSGTFTVNGANVNIAVTFNLVTYTVTFTESGLPAGTTWSVTLGGTTKSSNTNTITFSEPNGTYSYIIATVNKSYAPTQSSGTFTVNGA
ncbi:MAG: hypothetical protein ACP5QH_07830, partial [Thermoplasmata archaeon]